MLYNAIGLSDRSLGRTAIQRIRPRLPPPNCFRCRRTTVNPMHCLVNDGTGPSKSFDQFHPKDSVDPSRHGKLVRGVREVVLHRPRRTSDTGSGTIAPAGVISSTNELAGVTPDDTPHTTPLPIRPRQARDKHRTCSRSKVTSWRESERATHRHIGPSGRCCNPAAHHTDCQVTRGGTRPFSRNLELRMPFPSHTRVARRRLCRRHLLLP